MTDLIEVSKITKRIQVRNVKASGIEKLKDKINKLGFLPQHPLLVNRIENGEYELIDGNHRLDAAINLGLTVLPGHILSNHLSDSEKKKFARQANEASETMIPTTFVDDAEFVWKEIKAGKTQTEVAEIIGWSRDKVAKYDALRNIDKSAWKVIVTTFSDPSTLTNDEVVTLFVTTVTFTEGLLRSILDLTSEQQLELVKGLADGYINKGRFKSLAEAYRARNEMLEYALHQLGNLGEPYTTKLSEEIAKGAYDKDWQNTIDHPKLKKLIESLRDEWEKKHSIHLIHGDFYTEVKGIGNASIDLILTDPPYNITRDNEFELEGRSNISQDFGEWDKYADQEFIALFDIWANEWERILKPQGSGYVFTSDSYISRIREALENAGLHVKATTVWHKSNPGTQIVKTNFKSSVEYILFFTKGEGGHTFNWLGENEMHNFIENPICGGTERLVDAKGFTLHPTQKPERIIRHLTEISSNRGDVIFDGFMGVATTGKVAKDLGRKFIGIEQDITFFEAAQRRLAE